MTNRIELEAMSCPGCGLGVDGWTIKAEVVHGALGIRCPSCRTIIHFVMKGGEEEKEKVIDQAIAEVDQHQS